MRDIGSEKSKKVGDSLREGQASKITTGKGSMREQHKRCWFQNSKKMTTFIPRTFGWHALEG